MRVCSTHGCGQLVTSGRCPNCRRAAEKARGTASQRGYDAEHQRIRARLLAELVDGTPCRRCGQPMYRAQDLDAGHPPGNGIAVDGNSRADGLEHAECNRGAR